MFYYLLRYYYGAKNAPILMIITTRVLFQLSIMIIIFWLPNQHIFPRSLLHRFVFWIPYLHVEIITSQRSVTMRNAYTLSLGSYTTGLHSEILVPSMEWSQRCGNFKFMRTKAVASPFSCPPTYILRGLEKEDELGGGNFKNLLARASCSGR